MNLFAPKHRIGILIVVAALVVSIALPASASVLNSEPEQVTNVMAFSKNGTSTGEISFSVEDFRVIGNESASLDSIILTTLPAREAGILMVGDEPLVAGDVVAVTALEGMRFCPLVSPALSSTSFTFEPVFTSGKSGDPVNVNLYLLTEENNAPVAENIEFTTYKNVAYTGQFSAVDPEGDLVTFQLVDKPARGSVTLSEDGSAEFVYTPYENKTGKDSFTYVAIDAVGNTSDEATVKLKIEKPSTKVTYADMDGHPAYNAAIRLAEEEIFIGAKMDDSYYFQPDLPMTRVEFLALAMAATDSEVLSGIKTTGFYDDDSIETWAKPYVASALKSGTVQGALSKDGQIVFRGNNTITTTEAAVLLDRMLSVSDVAIETWSGNTDLIPTWACQSVMNLETVGILRANGNGTLILSDEMTRADAAQMLVSALNVIENRDNSEGWLNW